MFSVTGMHKLAYLDTPSYEIQKNTKSSNSFTMPPRAPWYRILAADAIENQMYQLGFFEKNVSVTYCLLLLASYMPMHSTLQDQRQAGNRNQIFLSCAILCMSSKSYFRASKTNFLVAWENTDGNPYIPEEWLAVISLLSSKMRVLSWELEDCGFEHMKFPMRYLYDNQQGYCTTTYW